MKSLDYINNIIYFCFSTSSTCKPILVLTDFPFLRCNRLLLRSSFSKFDLPLSGFIAGGPHDPVLGFRCSAWLRASKPQIAEGFEDALSCCTIDEICSCLRDIVGGQQAVHWPIQPFKVIFRAASLLSKPLESKRGS